MARPIAIDVDPRHDEPLRRWVEGVLGWQVVDRATGTFVPPTLHLVGPEAPTPDDRVPRILLVGDDHDPVTVADAARRLHPDAVVGWPRERDRLVSVVTEVVDRPTVAACVATLRLGGVAGGVGATTVALGLAGLAAWSGRRTLAGLRGPTPIRDAPVVPPSALGGADLWGRLPDVTGIGSLRAVRFADATPAPEPRDPAIDLAVIDHGVDTDVDVVVCRPDAAALSGLATTTAAAVVVVGPGAVSARDLESAAGGRRTITVPWSARVARAGATQRVPAGLPGTWLRRLAPLLPAVAEPD